MSIKVIIADNHKIIRDGLASLIGGRTGIELIAEARDGREVVKLARKLTPDVILMDVTMPNLNGVDATRKLLAASPGTKVLALSIHTDKRFVAGMLQAGASGYIPKSCSFEELIHAIKLVARGRKYLSPEVTGLIIEDYNLKTAMPVSIPLLTGREREVLQLIAEGNSTKEIAFELRLSVKTIETHRRHIMGKLGVKSVAELTKYAVREGLTSP